MTTATIPAINTANIPACLRERPQWVCWRFEQRGEGKPTKKPINAHTGYPAASTKPETWASFEKALDGMRKWGCDGLGFVFSVDDFFCGIDLDNCMSPEGEWEPWAGELINALDSYTEVSPSGNGLHIIVKATITDKLGSRRGDFECYDQHRFFTITGRFPAGLEHSLDVEDRQAELDAVREKMLAKPEPKQAVHSVDIPTWEDDKTLLEKSFGWKNGEKTKALVNGDTSGHASQSEADLALCNHLAFLMGKNPERMDRAFRESGLMREKWDKKHVQGKTYGEATIEKAIADCKECYGERSGYALTEDGIALAFAAEFKDQLRYDHHVGAWYEWSGAYWRKDETHLAFNWARELCRKLNFEGKQTFAKASTAGAVERFAQADRAFAVTSGVWDANPYQLGTPAGTVNLETGFLLPAQRSDLITKTTSCAPAEQDDCPLWKQFLDDATRGDKELQVFLHRVCGYMLTGLTTEHALFFVYGPGGNGKSVFLNTVANILGDYATTSSMDTFTASKHDRHPTDLAMLKGARLVSASETEEGRAWAESRIKQLTGGDKIAARFMRQDFFEFTPQFKLLIVGNHKPQLHNVDDAARRRFNIIPFVHKPSRPDKDLEHKLKAEYPAILRWMLNGCVDWQAHGLPKPPVVSEATDAYFNDQDIFGQWIEECCEVGPSKVEASATLFSSWKDFAERNGEHPGGTKTFANHMAKRGFLPDRKRIGGKLQRVYLGVALPPKEDDWKPYAD